MTITTKRLKPGPGWRHLAGAVWEHSTGVRIHLAGMVLLTDTSTVWGKSWPTQLHEIVRQCGGNRKRGLMCWALRVSRGDP